MNATSISPYHPKISHSRLNIFVFSLFSLLFLPNETMAFPVGERHFVATEVSAEKRNADHQDKLRVTIWYPALNGSDEQSLDIGPVNDPRFKPGSAAPDAPFFDTQRRPVILLSHGFGGSARIMAWFGTALAREGYIVIAPDHPGNNSLDPMTLGGALLFWKRPADLATALHAAETEPLIREHLDLSRVGVAGFSAGGFTSLSVAGARVDLSKLLAFCKAQPTDGVCAPQKEFPISYQNSTSFFKKPEVVSDVALAGDDMSIPEVKAAFVMAPALVQSFNPTSLRQIKIPVTIIAGDSDITAPPSTNADIAASLISGSQIYHLPKVTHYDFLSECGPNSIAHIDICHSLRDRKQIHQDVLYSALNFFDKTLQNSKK
ncbi:alpha/beta fold hydrolase [Komagataeibacter sp. FNDCF1]|uniref:alpha/beta hydrolase family protein n=1 Tax=Komagataeibacter sp. FNDCF1 TaxID=2878681 RepID=UPI001E2A4BAD|nr:alpha/beta fold hydrolase [Komagataeibacter sp. FNDCF1]MCE2564636.1 alpha/beta fold hydrolase [Komagataeibacter sp. FNDCF1]